MKNLGNLFAQIGVFFPYGPVIKDFFLLFFGKTGNVKAMEQKP